ncbi:MAG: ankyrin repeat domain-containing protein [Alphaproteobacteria bacterium]
MIKKILTIIISMFMFSSVYAKTERDFWNCISDKNKEYKKFDNINNFIQNTNDINITNKNGNTILHLTVYCAGNKNHIDILYKNGININLLDKHGNSALYTAIMLNDISLISKLIDVGSDVNILTNSKVDALRLSAIYSTNIEIFNRILNKSNRKINDRLKLDNLFPLYAAALKNKNPDFIKGLIKNGADANMRSYSKLTGLPISIKPIHAAKNNKYLKDTQAINILEEKTNINYYDKLLEIIYNDKTIIK